MSPDFWRGRRVFVTGHTGFKGAWLLVLLHELGAEVTGFSLEPPTSPSLFDLIGGPSFCQDVRGDIRDLPAVEAAMAKAQPEVVIHMAAQSLVRDSYVNPVDTYAVNVMGTVHVMDACRRADRVRSAVMVTTDKCYENLGWVWGYRESDRLGGADPYSNSKAACELAVDSYRRSFFSPSPPQRHRVSLASARAGNVIGGGDFATDRLVPDAMRAFARGEKLSIRNPLAIRPWQHVLEPLWGYLMLAERLYVDSSAAQGWNFGPPTNENASVMSVVETLAKHWAQNSGWVQDEGFHPYEAATLKLDSTKARIELGWKPAFELEKALQITTDWYRAWADGVDLRGLTMEQARAYMRARNVASSAA